MATIINITNKIKREPKFMVYDGKQYVVDGSKNAFIQVLAIKDDPEIGEIERIDRVLDLLIGKKARKELDALGLDFEDYQVVVAGAMAAASGQSQKEFEDSFRDEEAAD